MAVGCWRIAPNNYPLLVGLRFFASSLSQAPARKRADLVSRQDSFLATSVVLVPLREMSRSFVLSILGKSMTCVRPLSPGTALNRASLPWLVG